jgi:molybdopterin/thiamine biosynthesis adenylyltransferase/molybdopterin converting factor small subunit
MLEFTPAQSAVLSARTAVVVGVGGLGCPAALALARAGIGRLVLVDDDTVEQTNLHRQILYDEADVGQDKLEAAARSLAREGLARDRIVLLRERFLPRNAATIARLGDVLLEGTDSYPAKFLASDAAHAAGRPVVHGAAIRWLSTALAVAPTGQPCYRCLFEQPPEEAATCATAGVMGPVVGIAGALMADLALRSLLDNDAFGCIYTYDGKRDQLRTVKISPRATCPTCGRAARASYPDPPEGARRPVKGTEPMDVTVRIPTQLRTLTAGEEEVKASGQTIKDIIESLERNHPGIRERLMSDKGVQRFVNIYVGEEDIRFLDGLDTELRGGEEISIVPAIAGG